MVTLLGSGGPSPSSSSFNFGIVDARSEERRKARVKFNESVLAKDPSDPADGLNVENWQVDVIPPSQDPEIKPYVYVNVERVERVSGFPNELDVIVDLDFSFDVQYKVTANTRIQSSLPGSWTIDGTSQFDFDAYDPPCRNKPMPKIYDWLGRAVKAFDTLRDVERIASVFQDVMEQVKSLIDCFAEIFDPLFCNEDFLDSRLESLGNPFAPMLSEMTLTEKRRLAVQLVNIYRKKGTLEGVIFVLEFILGIEDLYLIPFNQATAILNSSTSSVKSPITGSLFALGNGLYVPDGSGGVGYPTVPIDPRFPSNEQFTGNFFLGPGKPQYVHAILGDGASKRERGHVARLNGQWNLSDGSVQRMPLFPNDDFDENQVTEERNRKALYSYRIVSDSSLTDLQVKQIRSLAEYMQPANTHLVEILQPPSTSYTPVVLGVSVLGVDWTLHAS